MKRMAVFNGRGSTAPRVAIVLLAVCLLVMGVQGITVPMTDADRVADADEIVRGTIGDLQSVWNDDHTGIVTTASVSVKARVKGRSPDTFTIAVLGGTADGITEWVEDEPVLVQGGEAYLFIRKDSSTGVQAHGRAQSVAPVSKGKVPGNSQKNGAGIPVAEYDQYLQNLAQGRTVARPAVIEPQELSPRAVTATPVISSVVPSTGSAGTGTTVTITGTGFGTKASRGSYADVGFLYAYYDDGSWDAIWASGFIGYDDYGDPVYLDNANDIVSWTDTQIVVRIPTGTVYDSARESLYSGSAASGVVAVFDDAGTQSALKPFTVTFGYGKMKWDAPAQYYVNPGSLGAGALTAVNNAANTWNTAGYPGATFRYDYAGQTSSTVFGQNGQSLISFGPASDFSSSNIIAHARVWLRTGTTIITEADIEYNSGFSWTTGTASGNTMNVEHITLHELGHWLQLRDLYGWAPDRPSDTAETMFGMTDDYFGNMNDKTLHADDIAGIRWIYPDSQMTVGSITPNSGTTGSTVVITNLAGTGFASGATVKLTRPGSTDIAATSVAVGSATKITCQFAIPATAAIGAWNVVVTSGGRSATLASGFTINTPPTPTITSIAPNSGTQGTTVAITSLAGTGFASGATVKLTRTGSTDIAATNVVFVSATQLTCQFVLPSAAATGAWNVVVTNPNTQSATLSGGFTINPPLTVTAITPTSSTAGTTVAITNLAGTGFLSGATVKLTRTGSADIAATGVAVTSANKITCSFALPSTAATGAWNVVITSGGQSATLTNGFTINPPLTVIAITPTSGTAGATVAITNLAGTGFVSGATVKLTRTGSTDIAATIVTVVSANKITCSFALPSSAALGAWNVVVTNPNGQSATLSSGFTVTTTTTTAFRFAPGTLQVPVGRTGTTTLYLDNLPAGLAGFDITLALADPSAGEIIGAALPGWAMTDISALPADSVTLTAVDLDDVVGDGDNALIGTITVRGDRAAQTELRLTRVSVDDDDGNAVTPQQVACTVAVGASGVQILPGGTGLPRDLDQDGLYDDVNGNGRADFADVVLYFNQMAWIAANEPVSAFDYNGNGRIDFADVSWLFNQL